MPAPELRGARPQKRQGSESSRLSSSASAIGAFNSRRIVDASSLAERVAEVAGRLGIEVALIGAAALAAHNYVAAQTTSTLRQPSTHEPRSENYRTRSSNLGFTLSLTCQTMTTSSAEFWECGNSRMGMEPHSTLSRW